MCVKIDPLPTRTTLRGTRHAPVALARWNSRQRRRLGQILQRASFARPCRGPGGPTALPRAVRGSAAHPRGSPGARPDLPGGGAAAAGACTAGPGRCDAARPRQASRRAPRALMPAAAAVPGAGNNAATMLLLRCSCASGTAVAAQLPCSKAVAKLLPRCCSCAPSARLCAAPGIGPAGRLSFPDRVSSSPPIHDPCSQPRPHRSGPAVTGNSRGEGAAPPARDARDGKYPPITSFSRYLSPRFPPFLLKKREVGGWL
jgi:hypothetical protein